MKIAIGLCHVELENIDTFSELIIEAIALFFRLNHIALKKKSRWPRKLHDGINNRLWKGIYYSLILYNIIIIETYSFYYRAFAHTSLLKSEPVWFELPTCVWIEWDVQWFKSHWFYICTLLGIGQQPWSVLSWFQGFCPRANLQCSYQMPLLFITSVVMLNNISLKHVSGSSTISVWNEVYIESHHTSNPPQILRVCDKRKRAMHLKHNPFKIMIFDILTEIFIKQSLRKFLNIISLLKTQKSSRNLNVMYFEVTLRIILIQMFWFPHWMWKLPLFDERMMMMRYHSNGDLSQWCQFHLDHWRGQYHFPHLRQWYGT